MFAYLEIGEGLLMMVSFVNLVTLEAAHKASTKGLLPYVEAKVSDKLDTPLQVS
jgi:hypothetical protein